MFHSTKFPKTISKHNFLGVTGIDKNVFKDILKECDLNDDGEVDFEEFQKCMKQI